MDYQNINLECDWHVRPGDIRAHAGYILKEELWTDCSFVVGSEQQTELKAHKLLLALASPVFEAMFYGPIAERDAPIRIPDVEPDAFRAMLKHIYTDTLIVESESAIIDLYYAAQKYLLIRTMKHCSEKLKNMYLYDTESVCRLYEFGLANNEDILIKHSEKIIERNPKQVFSSKAFLELNAKSVSKIFSMDPLEVNSEIDMLRAFDRYLKKFNTNHVMSDDERQLKSPCPHCPNSRKSFHPKGLQIHIRRMHKDLPRFTSNIGVSELREALQQIRFLTLTPKQLAEKKTLLQSLLTTDELTAISNNVNAAGDPNNTLAMPKGFSTSRIPRKSLPRPNRPESAFNIWQKIGLRLVPKDLSRQHGGLKRAARQMWSKLEDKTEWNKKAAEAKAQYDKEMAVYREKYPNVKIDDEDVNSDEHSSGCDCSTCDLEENNSSDDDSYQHYRDYMYFNSGSDLSDCDLW